jgi:hypothetical protein
VLPRAIYLGTIFSHSAWRLKVHCICTSDLRLQPFSNCPLPGRPQCRDLTILVAALDGHSPLHVENRALGYEILLADCLFGVARVCSVPGSHHHPIDTFFASSVSSNLSLVAQVILPTSPQVFTPARDLPNDKEFRTLRPREGPWRVEQPPSTRQR